MGSPITNDASFTKELDELDIKKFFDLTLPAHALSDLDKEWRKNDQVKIILNTFKINPNECVLVGDYVADIKTARDFGMKCVLIGKRKTPTLKADLEIDDYSNGLNLEFLE